MPGERTPLPSGRRAKLDPPPRLPAGALRVVALGGISEIGRNMTVYEFDGRLLVVDCGVLFPEDGQPGVDLILPDLRLVEDRVDDIEAVVITHGHEDHIGALPWLLRLRTDLPVIGARFSLALIAAKCKEHRITPKLQVVAEGDRRRSAPFDLQFFAVNHSIPDALAVGIRTPAGTVLHTGDIKLDQLPLDGRLTDLGGFSKLGDEGVDLFLVDSTNAEVPGFVAPEREIGPVMDACICKATQRVIVASFASHVHRVQQMIDSAAAHGRKIAFVGRSMVRNMQIAQDLGLLTVPDGLVRSLDKVLDLPPEQVLLISTGSQGEPLSALSRMSRGEHRQVNLRLRRHRDPGVVDDPGQRDQRVHRDQRAGPDRRHRRAPGRRQGPRVRATHRPASCCSSTTRSGRRTSSRCTANGGTCGRRRNSRWRPGFRRTGWCWRRTAPSSTWSTAGPGSVGHIEVGMVYVDGNAVGDVGEDTLSDRLILGEGGFISITVAIDAYDRAARSPRRRSPAAASPTTPRRWTRWCRWSRRSSPGWRPTASPTRTGSPRRCAGSSAAGSPTPTGAGR